ncbi:hypothetical protein NORO109296_10975 [Nocardiopsis rhodophaea]
MPLLRVGVLGTRGRLRAGVAPLLPRVSARRRWAERLRSAGVATSGPTAGGRLVAGVARCLLTAEGLVGSRRRLGAGVPTRWRLGARVAARRRLRGVSA